MRPSLRKSAAAWIRVSSSCESAAGWSRRLARPSVPSPNSEPRCPVARAPAKKASVAVPIATSASSAVSSGTSLASVGRSSCVTARSSSSKVAAARRSSSSMSSTRACSAGGRASRSASSAVSVAIDSVPASWPTKRSSWRVRNSSAATALPERRAMSISSSWERPVWRSTLPRSSSRPDVKVRRAMVSTPISAKTRMLQREVFIVYGPPRECRRSRRSVRRADLRRRWSSLWRCRRGTPGLQCPARSRPGSVRGRATR